MLYETTTGGGVMPRWLKCLLSPDGDAGDGGAGSSDSTGTGTSSTASGSDSRGSGSADGSEDNAKLQSALVKERAERKALEAKLKTLSKSQESQKSLDDRLAELEADNKKLRLKERVTELLGQHSDKAAKDGYKVDVPGARDLLADMNLTDDNVEAAVAKVVSKLRAPASGKSADNTQAPGERAAKFDVSSFDFKTASLEDWMQLHTEDPRRYESEVAKRKAFVSVPITEVLSPAPRALAPADSRRR